MFYESFLRPILFRLDPESAHELSLEFLSVALKPAAIQNLVSKNLSMSPFGALERFGLTFDNPVGLAAGLDKNSTATRALAALGFGFVEIGTVTNIPQPGNPKPRLFRLPADQAIINRAGFNNDGADVVCERLLRARPKCVLGVNIGKSRIVDIDEAEQDYLASYTAARKVADYVAINVSSPNTPNLRELQKPEALRPLLETIRRKEAELSAAEGHRFVPLLVKIAPDLEIDDLKEIVAVILESGVSGIIATNTTIERAGLSVAADVIDSIGAGGLSGAPLRLKSTRIIAELYRLVGGKIPIIGVGGIFSAEDAWEKICAGASLVQVYTGLIYKGPLLIHRINTGLMTLLDQSEYSTLDEAVGSRSEEFARARVQLN